MTTDTYAVVAATCAFVALVAIIVGFVVGLASRNRRLIIGTVFDPLPLFTDAHHRRDFDVLTERWIDARIWLRKQGRIPHEKAPAVPQFLKRRARLRVA